MVKVQRPSEDDVLDAMIRTLAQRHGLSLDVEGWSRKTYDLLTGERLGKKRRVARVESFVTRDGVIRVFDDVALPFAEALGAEIEKAFPAVREAVVLRDRLPE